MISCKKVNYEDCVNLKERYNHFYEQPVVLTDCGQYVNLVCCSHYNTKATIQKLNASQYVVLSTGEIKEFSTSSESRQDNITSLKRSQKRLRDLINTNFEYPYCTNWITLTYKENMTDRAAPTRSAI